MTRNVEIRIDLTPKEIETLIWDLPSDQQAKLLIAIGERYKAESANVCEQLEYIKDELSNKEPSDNIYYLQDRYAIVKALRTILEYIGNKETAIMEGASKKWIPTSEKLPDETGVYIITDERRRVFLDSFIKESGKWYASSPLAWQPIPAPYLESEDE